MFFRRFAVVLATTGFWTVASPVAAQGSPAAGTPNYVRLAHPDVADRMQLTDQQRSSVTRLLTERAQRLSEASGQERDAAIAESNEKLAALLTDPQREILGQMSSQRELQFNFREAKWEDVLDWFAKQANLSLVIDRPPAGNFSYTDTKSYSPTEAIDLLNSVLATKGFTLIRRERMLLCLDISSGKVPDGLIPRVQLEALDQHGQNELVSVMFQLGKKPAQTVLDEITPLFGPFGEGAALSQTKQLLVTETAGKMRAISILIASIPEPKEPKKPEPKPKEPPKPKPELEVYPVHPIDPNAAVEILKKLLSKATFAVDTKTDQINAYATPDEQKAIKKVLDQMMANNPQEKEPRLDIYPLARGDLGELEEQIRLVAPDLQFTIDAEKQRLLVFGEPKIQEAVKAALAQLEATSLEGGDREVVVFQLRRASAERVASILESIAPNAEIVADEQARRIVARASAAEQRAIRELMQQIEPPEGATDAPVLQIHVVPDPAPSDLVNTLKALAPRAGITLQANGRRLSVVATPADHDLIGTALRQLESAERSVEKSVLRIYSMTPRQRQRYDAIADSLRRDLPGIRTVDAASKGELMIWATSAQHEILKPLVDSLLQELPDSQRPKLQVYSMAPRQRERFNALVGSLTSDMPGMQTVDTASKDELMIWATPSQHEMLIELIDSLQREVPEGQQNRLTAYSLEEGDLTSAQTMLGEMYPDVKIVLDSRTGHLLVWARPEEHVDIGRVIQQIDLPPDQADEPVLQLYDVPRLAQDELLDALRSVAPQAKLNLRADGQRLSVVATDDDQKLIAKAIDELKTMDTSADKHRLQVYSITPDQRKRFDAVIDSLQQDLPGIKIIRDARPGELSIWARESQHKVIQPLIDSLRHEVPEGEELQVAGYSVETTDPSRVSEMLNELYPAAKILIDEDSGRLLVWTTPAQQAQIKQAIEQLDGPLKPGAAKSLMAYPVGDRDPEDMIDALRQLVPQMTLTADRRAREIVAWGRGSDHQLLARTIEQFRQGDPTKQRTLVVYKTGPRDPDDLQNLIEDMAPEARAVADDVGRSVAVWGNAEEHRAIGQAIQQIVGSSPGDSDYSLVVYTFQRISPREARFILRELVPGAELISGYRSDDLVAWASAEQHAKLRSAVDQIEKRGLADRGLVLEMHRLDDQISNMVRDVVEDALPGVRFASGSSPDKLLIWARPEQHTAIQTIIKTLKAEVDSEEKKTIAVYALEKVDQSTARQVLQDVVRELTYLTSADPRKMLILATPERHKAVKEALDRLEQSAPEPEVSNVRVYPLGKIDPSTVNQALDPRLLEGASVITDSQKNRLIVRTTDERHAKIKEALAKVLPELPPEEERESRVYRLEVSDPEAARVVLAPLVPYATLAVDTVNRSLVATALPSDHVLIQQTVAQLDQGGADAPETRVYPFQSGDPQTAQTVLQSLLPSVTFAVDTKNRSLAATARPSDHEKIKATVDQMDQEGMEGYETRVYRFKKGNAVAARYSLQPLLPDATFSADYVNNVLIVTARVADHEKIQSIVDKIDRTDEEGYATQVYTLAEGSPSAVRLALIALLPDATIAVDNSNDSLIATASEQDHKTIADVVQQIESAGSEGYETRVYRFKRANANGARYVLRSLIPKATLYADPYNNALIATASVEDHETIDSIIQEVDIATIEGAETRVYRVADGDPNTVQEALESLLSEATIITDRDNGTLIATASLEDHKTIESVVQKMDLATAEGYETKVYHLREGDASSVETALQSLLPEATVVGDRRNGTLIATASAKDQEKIKGVVEQMDRAGSQGYETRVYRFRDGSATSARYVLQALLPDATIISDYRTNTLLATARVEDHERIKTVVQQMDMPDEDEATAKAYVMQNAAPEAVYDVLRTMYRRDYDVSLSFDEESSAVLVVADARKHAAIGQLVTQMESTSALTKGAVLQVYSLTNVDSLAILPALEGLFETRDPKSNFRSSPIATTWWRSHFPNNIS